MAEVESEAPLRLLDPMERISEILFGVIMALTFTLTLGVATADDIKIRTMLAGALGCNLAWGIVDAGMYLLARVQNQGRRNQTLRAIGEAPDVGAARRVIAEALSPHLASTLPPEWLESVRHKLRQSPVSPARLRTTRRDALGALAICLLSFLSTFPIVIPFIFIDHAKSALRVSNAVAIAMLFACGWAFGRRAGIRAWIAGLAMVVLGGALVGVAIALGG